MAPRAACAHLYLPGGLSERERQPRGGALSWRSCLVDAGGVSPKLQAAPHFGESGFAKNSLLGALTSSFATVGADVPVSTSIRA